jgi:hypothetical protein
MRLVTFLALAPAAFAQSPEAIRVNPAPSSGQLAPIWSFFGHDEPNYTYMSKLPGELAALSPVPVYMRVHSLLVIGDGKAWFNWEKLQMADSPRWVAPADGSVPLAFDLPLHGVSLIRLTW